MSGAQPAWHDKSILISGAGRGLGRALALTLASQGAKLALNDLTPVNLDETIELVRQRGGEVIEVLGDVSQKMAVQGLLLRTEDAYGRVDLVIHNAAVRPRGSLLDMDEWDWRRALDVNLTGAFFLTQIAGRVMRAQGGGRIVLIGSQPESYPSTEMHAAYLASKAGLTAFAQAAAIELAPHNVSVELIEVGLLDSESTRESLPSGQNGAQPAQLSLEAAAAGILQRLAA